MHDQYQWMICACSQCIDSIYIQTIMRPIYCVPSLPNNLFMSIASLIFMTNRHFGVISYKKIPPCKDKILLPLISSDVSAACVFLCCDDKTDWLKCQCGRKWEETFLGFFFVLESKLWGNERKGHSEVRLNVTLLITVISNTMPQHSVSLCISISLSLSVCVGYYVTASGWERLCLIRKRI